MKYTKSEYKKYIEKKSPNSPIWKNILFAFVVGGIICTIGQAFSELYKNVFNLSEELVKTAVPITMVFLGALLTALNLYHKIAKFAGAGTLVPITGFANAVVSPAMEFRREGLILGLASKMFVVAGPVLVYGINTSIILGLIYYFIKIL